MISKFVIFFYLCRSSDSFVLRPSKYSTRAVHVQANKIDDHTVDGEFLPITGNIFVRVKDTEGKTYGGVLLPDSAKEKPTEGTVAAVGSGKSHPETGFMFANSVSVGDKVLYGKYDGTELKYNGINHQVIKDEDILFKYQGESPSIDTVECVRDMVLVELPSKEEMSNTGLILTTAEGSKSKTPTNGKVAKVGPGKQTGNGSRIPIPLVPGDNVKISYTRPNEVRIEGKDYTVVRASDILAKY